MPISFDIIAACDASLGIGKNSGLNWHLPGDMAYFSRVTKFTKDPDTKNVVIMGRKTWESLPSKYQPLPGRINVVLTHSAQYGVPEDVLVSNSLSQSLDDVETLAQRQSIGRVFVVGGGQVYQEAIQSPRCQHLLLTHLLSSFDCDVFFPEFEDHFLLKIKSDIKSENGIDYYFATYTRRAP